jgi:hypothetical protein
MSPALPVADASTPLASDGSFLAPGDANAPSDANAPGDAKVLDDGALTVASVLDCNTCDAASEACCYLLCGIPDAGVAPSLEYLENCACEEKGWTWDFKCGDWFCQMSDGGSDPPYTPIEEAGSAVPEALPWLEAERVDERADRELGADGEQEETHGHREPQENAAP